MGEGVGERAGEGQVEGESERAHLLGAKPSRLPSRLRRKNKKGEGSCGRRLRYRKRSSSCRYTTQPATRYPPEHFIFYRGRSALCRRIDMPVLSLHMDYIFPSF